MMTPERFAHLAEAYGADLHRWPAAEQPDAQALLHSGDTTALTALQQARQLDRLLDSHQLAPVDPALARRIRLSAPVARPTSFWTRYAGWLSPAGVIGVGIAGVAVGMLVASLSLPTPRLAPDILPSVFDQGDAEMVFTVNAEEAEQ